MGNLLASPDVGGDAPEGCSNKESDVLSELEEGALEAKFIDHGGED